MQPEKMESINLGLQKKYQKIKDNEVRFETIMAEDADYIVISFGLTSRSANKALQLARAEGIKVGILRPQTLFPFPIGEIQNLTQRVKGILVVEMNAGQMVDDVRLAVNGKIPVEFYGRMGGMIPQPEDILSKIVEMKEKIEKSEARK